MTQLVLAVLAEDRRRSVARDAALARRFRLRRSLAAFVYRLAALAAVVAVALDDEAVWRTRSS
ncbi:MAG TPA: hypothetical protein VE591_06625, partial [Candidatus Acidoferrum sp.]|nr:hypothetical protein [Candidatus Acidoferrum sp.]